MDSEAAKQLRHAWLFLLILGAGVGYLYLRSQPEPANTTPVVVIGGRAAGAVSFTSWRVDGAYLRSDMTLRGGQGVPLINDIRFAAFDGHGVKLDEGPVEHPSVKVGETVRASILVTHQETRRVVVTAD